MHVCLDLKKPHLLLHYKDKKSKDNTKQKPKKTTIIKLNELIKNIYWMAFLETSYLFLVNSKTRFILWHFKYHFTAKNKTKINQTEEVKNIQRYVVWWWKMCFSLLIENTFFILIKQHKISDEIC